MPRYYPCGAILVAFGPEKRAQACTHFFGRYDSLNLNQKLAALNLGSQCQNSQPASNPSGYGLTRCTFGSTDHTADRGIRGCAQCVTAVQL
jgi:hypothetical protein